MARKLTKKEWKKRKRIKAVIVVGGAGIIALTIMCVTVILISKISGLDGKLKAIFVNKNHKYAQNIGTDLEINEMFITPNEYSRPQIELNKVKGVVIHYTANPGTDAEANRNYFDSLSTQTGSGTSVSSHFVVGLKGNIIQCIPTDEIAYASNDRNSDTISIECCHEDETGKFSKKTYNSLVKLTAYLCLEYNLDRNDILRHYDVTGKDCPRYFVANEDKWEDFKDEVFDYIDNYMK